MATADPASRITPAIQQAIDEIEVHAEVHQVIGADVDPKGVTVRTEWSVRLANRDRHQGVSKKGVQAIEPVYWRFPVDYPLYAPQPFLREDFPINLPHINHHTEGKLVNPCIVALSLDELLHSGGLRSLLDAMTHWLDHAAADELQCPVQGWEYVRRDNAQGSILIDTHALRGELAAKNNTVRFFKYLYFYATDSHGPFFGSIQTPSLGSANSVLKGNDVWIGRDTEARHAPAVLLQTSPGKIFAEYRPEMVDDFQSLSAFANYLGLTEAFHARLNHVLSIASPATMRKASLIPIEEFLVVFAIQRPFHLIGTDSQWELLPYRVLYNMAGDTALPNNAKVIPVQFHEKLTPKLLQKVSDRKTDNPIHIGTLGCGSLGSKVTIHLGKTGCYTFDLVDNDSYSNHNNARYGLIVSALDKLSHSKAKLLSREMKLLGIVAKPFHQDICLLGKKEGYTLKKGTAFLIDTTASLKVRHFLAHQCHKLPGQLIHTLLHDKASTGLVAIEANNRCVRVDDLMAYANALCISSSSLQTAMYGQKAPELHYFGEGCGSVTTTMSDMALSLMSAGIALKIDSEITSKENRDSGILHVGTLDKDSLAMAWNRYIFPATQIIPRDSSFEWEIRILGQTVDEIQRLSNMDPTIENGGVIAGQVCALSRTIYVTTLLPAPAGSLKSKNRFDLATLGLADQFETIHKKTNGQITFLGTWHSHTKPTPPSSIDKASLQHLDANYDLPVVMLTYTGGRLVRV